MRACFIVLFLALFSGCQSLPLFDSIVRQDSTLSFGKLGGAHGEVVISIVADSSGTVFAGTPGKGVYRSTDAGKSWEATALQEGAVYPLYVTPTGKLFAFIRKSFFDRTIAVSIDKGNTWEILPGKYDRYIGSTVMRFMGGTIYSEGMKEYRIGGAGLHRSTDDGVTWTTLQDDALSQHCSGEYPLEILSDSSMFITCSDGIYHSRDQGISWRKLPLPFGYFSGLRQDPKGGVRTEVQDSIMDPDSRSLIRIDPSGDSWEVVSSKRPLLDRSSPMVLQSGTVLIGNEAWSTGIWRSVDRGHSWQETSLTAGAVNEFCETPDGKVYVAMHGAIFTSVDDGRTWMESSGGLGPRSITQLFKDDSRNIWAGTALGGLFRSTDNGSSWSRSTPGLYDVQRGFSLAPGHVLIGTGSAIPDAIYERKGNIRIRCFVFGGWEIHVSHDTGATWTSPNVRSWGNWVIEPGQDMHVYTSGQEHNFSTDGGDTWSTEAMFSGARDIQATSGGIYVVRNDTLFYRNPDSREWHSLLVRRFLGNVANIGSAILCMTPSRLLRSTDHGKSWNTWIKERGETGFKGFIIVADSIVALAGAHPYIYLSTDYGASWQKIHLEIGQHDRITGAVLDSARHLILGTSVGLFRSTAPMLHN